MHCYVNWNGGAWFVKEGNFFELQEKEDPSGWRTHWRPIYDVDGIEHARDKARMIWGEKGERWSSKRKTDDDPMPHGHQDITDSTLGPEMSQFRVWMSQHEVYSGMTIHARFHFSDMEAAFEAGLKEARDGMASKLIDQWATINNKPVPWRIAVEIVSVIGKLPEAETQRLLNLDKV